MIDGIKHAIRITSAVASRYENLQIRRALKELAREFRRQLHHMELNTVDVASVKHQHKGIEHGTHRIEVQSRSTEHETRHRKQSADRRGRSSEHAT